MSQLEGLAAITKGLSVAAISEENETALEAASQITGEKDAVKGNVGLKAQESPMFLIKMLPKTRDPRYKRTTVLIPKDAEKKAFGNGKMPTRSRIYLT